MDRIEVDSVEAAERRQADEDAQARRRRVLPLLQRARLAELEHEGWMLACIREAPSRVVVRSPKGRALVLTVEGHLADPMGVTLRDD